MHNMTSGGIPKTALTHMKELKDIKEAENQPNNNVVPPFLQKPATTPPPSRLVNVNPLIIVFDGPPNSPCEKSLNITNISNDRIAWRVLSNAPTRYVVSPNKGFLFKQEKVDLRVILLNILKHHRRHSFVVQVKVAGLDENNRKLTWRDMSVTESKRVQNTRINTLCSTSLDTTPVTSSASSASSVSSADLTPVSSSKSSAACSKQSAVKDADHGQYAPKVKELTEQIKQAAEQKQANTERMVAAVNEVKKLEVELDRAGQNLAQIQQKFSDHEAVVAELRVRARKLQEQLSIAREADRKRNGI
ncbi:hypothetical protein RB195_009366 [Necator americanus]|uniref:Major sperm protein n=1 Tax=Necator americanus TaxID=51031 RepID=A0ABR1CUC3_NECAM